MHVALSGHHTFINNLFGGGLTDSQLVWTHRCPSVSLLYVEGMHCAMATPVTCYLLDQTSSGSSVNNTASHHTQHVVQLWAVCCTSDTSGREGGSPSPETSSSHKKCNGVIQVSGSEYEDCYSLQRK